MKAVIRSLQRVEMKKKANLRKSDGCKAKRSQQKAADKEEKGGNVGSAGACGEFHRFTEDELSGVQSRLLEWYDVHKRDLPWRKQILVSDVNQRAYGVWVSEIMLQQTQVATVVDYYTRWMKICLALPCPALPCLALPCPALPCLALPCPALPCLAMPCLALPCPALPCPVLPCLALPCLALPCLALPCLALPCPAMPCLALPCLALPCLALPCPALPCLALPCLALPCPALPCHALPCLALLCLALPCLALPCLALPCLALPCPALPCPALPCLALPCPALPCLALPCLALSCPALPFLALPCLALPCPALPCPALPCLALPCPALPCFALPCPALPCLALPCPALPCPVLPCLALPCLALPCLALPCLALPCPALPCLALPCLALPCPALPCLASPVKWSCGGFDIFVLFNFQKWPTLQDLAEAKLEAVNEMWSGLGYYSRAKRLHQGAQKVVQELGGEMPTSREALQRHLPGVGRYTAGAIASIALAQKCGVVDGNVIRVLSRLRMIGANSAAQATMDAFWALAESLAVCERPGDLNQGLMELGAKVCTPRAPLCSTCPLAHSCKAFAKVGKDKKRSADRLMSKKDTSTIPDIECLAEGCGLCLPTTDPWNSSLGVENFPRKAKKKAAREQRCCVCVVRRVDLDGQARFLTLQRPHQGLLAGLWEFPSTGEIQAGIEPSAPEVLQQLRDCLGLEVSHAEELAYLGQVVHIFSHIHQTYLVSTATVMEDNITMATEKEARWLTRAELDTAALPTAMRKGVKRKAEEAATDAKKQQRSIDTFFTPKR
ncbi:hypothetical protein ACOMHN_009622 [Nucella lapillus]